MLLKLLATAGRKGLALAEQRGLQPHAATHLGTTASAARSMREKHADVGPFNCIND